MSVLLNFRHNIKIAVDPLGRLYLGLQYLLTCLIFYLSSTMDSFSDFSSLLFSNNN